MGGFRWSMLMKSRAFPVTNNLQLILIPFTVSQIGTNVYGSGLYMVNVKKDWRPMHWHVSFWLLLSTITLTLIVPTWLAWLLPYSVIYQIIGVLLLPPNPYVTTPPRLLFRYMLTSFSYNPSQKA